MRLGGKSSLGGAVRCGCGLGYAGDDAAIVRVAREDGGRRGGCAVGGRGEDGEGY